MPSHYHQPGGLLSPSAFPVPFDPRDPASRNPYDQIKGFATRKASEVAENPLSALLGAALQDPLMLADLSGASSSGRVKRESAGYGSLLGEPPIEVQGLPAGDISRQQLGIDNPAGMTGEMSPLSIGGMLKVAGKGLLGAGQTALSAMPLLGAVARSADGYSTRFATKKAFNDWAKNTPNDDPSKRQIMYEVLEEQRAKINAGILERDGRPFGSPKGTTPEKREQLVQQYADRIERAEEAFPPGYFYEEGRQSIRQAVPDPSDQRVVAHQVDLTSSQVGPADNVNYLVRGRDQRAMGQEVNTTLYPNKVRDDFNQVSEGVDIWTGYKRDRYGNLLTPEEARAAGLPESALMPPNDRWEFRGAGWPPGQVPTDPSNVAYVDKLREDALAIVNARRAEAGKPPLNLEQAQEMHWAVIRAESEGRPLVMNRGNDQIGGAMDRVEYSHTYEATPGLTAGQTVSPEGQQGLLGVFDQGGRDPLVASMGGDLQRPVVPARGYYEGQYNPGQTSRSLVSRTDSKGIDPSSQARVEATEAVRGLALGQDAVAGNVFTPISTAKNAKFNGVNIAGKVDDATLRNAVETAKSINPDMVVVNSPNGIRAWIPGDNSKAAQKQVQDFVNDVEMSGRVTYGKVESNYDQLTWANTDGDPRQMPLFSATEDVLNKIDDLGSGSPGLLGRADSPETRQVMGQIADKYDELKAAGLAMPNEKLVAVLKVWAKDGIEGVREMVKKGLAPAAVLAVFGASRSGLLTDQEFDGA